MEYVDTGHLLEVTGLPGVWVGLMVGVALTLPVCVAHHQVPARTHNSEERELKSIFIQGVNYYTVIYSETIPCHCCVT